MKLLALGAEGVIMVGEIGLDSGLSSYPGSCLIGGPSE